MNGHPTNEERQALIAGDRAGALAPDEGAELALLANLLGDPSTWTEPGAHLEDVVAHAVERAVPAADTAPVQSIERRARRGQMPRRRRIALSAVSVAAAVATIIGAVAVTATGPSADFTAKLSAVAAAPTANAYATFTKNKAGFRVVLDAHGLPKLPPDEYYQAWLKSSSGTLVPIGTFSSSDGRVTLWSGVSPADFPAISVTIEKADGHQGSSGNRVLAGPVHA